MKRQVRKLTCHVPYLTFGVDVVCRQHPALKPPGGSIALPRCHVQLQICNARTNTFNLSQNNSLHSTICTIYNDNSRIKYNTSILTSLKLIFIICLSALKPQSPCSFPSCSSSSTY